MTVAQSPAIGRSPSGLDDSTADAPRALGGDDQRRRGREANERIAALGEMARGIAHDFGNVLAVIESGLRLAEGSLDRPREVHTYLAGIREGIERGRRLTSRLLGFARPGEIDAQPGDANALIERMTPFLKYAVGPGIRIVLRLADRVPICRIEPSRFTAAMLNLVVNARDAMPDGGEIEIRTAAHAAGSGTDRCVCLLVSVTDSGLGMSDETAGRVFDTWFTTKGESGTGLGLPQVRHFAESSGGRVRVSSQVGIGTRVDLLFPAAGRRDGLPADLWRQLDRWTNEGGRPQAASEGAPPSSVASTVVAREESPFGNRGGDLPVRR
jgi:signal transduction histidine kinase